MEGREFKPHLPNTPNKSFFMSVETHNYHRQEKVDIFALWMRVPHANGFQVVGPGQKSRSETLSGHLATFHFCDFSSNDLRGHNEDCRRKRRSRTDRGGRR